MRRLFDDLPTYFLGLVKLTGVELRNLPEDRQNHLTPDLWWHSRHRSGDAVHASDGCGDVRYT